METIQDHALSNEEKTLIAMGAAMGAGCRTCADKLYEIAKTLNIQKEDVYRALLTGLEAKARALQTMQDKVSALMSGTADHSGNIPERLSGMIRIASYTAANSAPDFLREMTQAASRQITDKQIQLCISTAKMVRKGAMEFSDQEIADHFCTYESTAAGPCSSACDSAKSVSGCSCR